MTAVLACTPNTGRLIPLARALGTVGNSEPAAGIGTVCLLVPANDGRSRRAVEGITMMKLLAARSLTVSRM